MPDLSKFIISDERSIWPYQIENTNFLTLSTSLSKVCFDAFTRWEKTKHVGTGVWTSAQILLTTNTKSKRNERLQLLQMFWPNSCSLEIRLTFCKGGIHKHMPEHIAVWRLFQRLFSNPFLGFRSHTVDSSWLIHRKLTNLIKTEMYKQIWKGCSWLR